MSFESDKRYIKNSIEFEGCRFATLDCTPPSETRIDSQREFIALPDGWSLASDSPQIVENVIKIYTWGTHVLVLGNGKGYYTKGSQLPGRFFDDFCLESRGNERKPNNHCLRVLICRKHCCIGDAYRHRLNSSLWNDRRFSDCKVRCGEDIIHCHRAVLASASPVFDRMLSLDMTEGRQQEIVIRDSDAQIVKALLQFMYTGDCPVSQEIALPLLSLADFYQIDEVTSNCAAIALDSVDVDNVVVTARTFKALSERIGMKDKWSDLVEKVSKDHALLEIVMKSL